MEIQIKIVNFDEDRDNENTTYPNLGKATVRVYLEALNTYGKVGSAQTEEGQLQHKLVIRM